MTVVPPLPLHEVIAPVNPAAFHAAVAADFDRPTIIGTIFRVPVHGATSTVTELVFVAFGVVRPVAVAVAVLTFEPSVLNDFEYRQV
jgi:hypothetical protein